MDRNTLEQQALQHLNRGDIEAALRAYLGILRLDPRDLRIRQKAGDLYARTSRPNDAERMWREVYESLVASGSHRQAVAILKQLVALRPESARYQFDLGECYVNSGYPNDARGHYEQAIKLDSLSGKPIDAARAARRLAELSPADLTARLRLAELLEAGGDKHGAAKTLQDVMDEFRRRGRPDEVGRVAELALRLAPEDPGLLLDAASARIEAGDFKKALQHLQAAYPLVGTEPRTLDLLARAFEGQNLPDRAQKVLGELVKVGRDRGDVQVEADALRRAARLTPGDASLQAALADAESRLARRERRLTSLPLAEATSEDELRAVVRAEVYARYGFTDRAEKALGAALEARADSVPLRVALAELNVTMGRQEAAAALIERILPQAGPHAGAVADRLAILRGEAPRAAASPASTAAPAPAARETAEARGDRLAAAGDVPGAILAWREALSDDPMNDAVLAKIASLRTRPPPVVAPMPDPDEGTFAEISPDEEIYEDDADTDEKGDALFGAAEPPASVDDARAWVAVGRHADALTTLAGARGLEARVVEALALAGLGELARATSVLADATNDADSADEAYPEALFELAGLSIAAGKHRAASRLVNELLDLAPDFRTKDTLARQRGLARLLGT